MRVLAVGAHPDDLEYLCGGTLAKYCQQGHKVFMTNLANGSRGSTTYSQEELAEIRRGEAKAAADVIGAEYIPGGFVEDLEIYPNRFLRDKVTDLFRMTKPDVVLTLSSVDYSPDHTYTGQLVFDASHAATIPLYKTAYEAHANRVPILLMDSAAGLNFHPEEYVDISDTIELKKEMLRCHKSQFAHLKSYRDQDLVDTAVLQSRFRGLQAGVEYAEGFRWLRVGFRVRTERLLP
ncbi:MAG: PIG-L deacetylase family protein [Chloroflexota bacterium]